MTTSSTPETDQPWTERRMLELLHARYSQETNGTAERYVRAEHVATGYRNRIADFVAMDRWSNQGNGYKNVLIGHEVKVSRSDWLTEVRDPSKAWATKRYCDHWYLVVPSRDLVKGDELPEDWGLMVVSKNGALRVTKKAPRLTPEPMANAFMAGFGHAVARTAWRAPLHRTAPTEVVYPKRTWASRTEVCRWCGTTSPCPYHQAGLRSN